MTLEEIRLRQLQGQHLLAPGEQGAVVRGLMGAQAQFYGHALHTLKLRCAGEVQTGGLVKNWTLRGTLHLYAREDIPLFLDEKTYRLNSWEEPSFWNRRPDWALPPQRQRALSETILDILANGPMDREGLKAACRQAGMTPEEEGSMFHPWGGGIRELSERGFLHQLPGEGKAFALTEECVPLPEAGRTLELARRYFAYYGPATVRDAMYFFRATKTQVKSWLSRLPVTAVEAGGKTYYFIEAGRVSDGELPECRFLSGFDPLMLGYEKKESLYLKPEHLRKVFNLTGIVHPALLLHGEVRGTWKRKGNAVTVFPFAPLSPQERNDVSQEAARCFGALRSLDIL